jgi:hypothetical protein
MSTTALPACHEASPQHAVYVARVEKLEAEGCDTSDAQGIADMEFDQLLTPTKKPTKPTQKMKIQEINTLLDTINNLEKPEEIAQILCVPNNEDGSIHAETTLQDAIDDGTLWISLDIYAYRTFSAADELKRGNALDNIISQIEKMPGVAEVVQDGTADHVDYGNNPAFRVILK